MSLHPLTVTSNRIAVEFDVLPEVARAIVAQCSATVLVACRLENEERSIFVDGMVRSWEWIAPALNISTARMRGMILETLRLCSAALVEDARNAQKGDASCQQ